MSNKYAQSKIYKITGGGMTYIGSTTKKYLCQRMSGHRQQKKIFESGNGKGNYCSSYPILDSPDCQITLIETFPCESKDQLSARERYYIENNECVNKNIPGRTQQEYFKQWSQENRAKKLSGQKQWREQNKDHIAEYQRYYRAQQKNKLATETISKFAESPF